MAIEQLKLELHNHNRLGDILCMTCAVRDLATVRRCVHCGFECSWPGSGAEEILECPLCKCDFLKRKYRVKVNTSFAAIWNNNPYISDFDRADMLLRIGPGKGTQQSNHSGKHMCEAYRESIMDKSGNGIMFPQGELMPDLHFSDYEESQPPIIDGRYWIISPAKTTGQNAFSSKAWPFDYWQKVVDELEDITLVQIGAAGDVNPELEGGNVINLVGKTNNLRDLFGLFRHCDGSIGLVSMHAHIAAALRKPAVVIAGAREPVRFELYPFHKYLSNQGAMRCVGEAPEGHSRDHSTIYSCWKMSIEACPNKVAEYAKCLTMIKTDEVVKAVKDYYEGGILEPIDRPARINTVKRPVFKMVANGAAFGGGEKSSLWLMKAMAKEGYEVHFVTPSLGTEYRKNLPDYIKLTNAVTDPCDILMVYANDMVYSLKEKYAILADVRAGRKIMALNYRVGDVGKLEWTTNWDRYLFLCSDMEKVLNERVAGLDTMVLPSPADLSEFLKVDLGGLNKTPHIVRISSQGDQKYPPNFQQFVDILFDRIPGMRMTLMEAPSFLAERDRLKLLKKNEMPVIDALRQGNIFWYMLPDGYIDNGPRVLMEAMAVGLPVVADNRGGAKDRLTPECGWLCNSHTEHIEVLLKAHGKILNEKGVKAKERARTFDPHKWVDAIIG